VPSRCVQLRRRHHDITTRHICQKGCGSDLQCHGPSTFSLVSKHPGPVTEFNFDVFCQHFLNLPFPSPCILSLSPVDFNEEFSALHGHSLMEQAQFLNDAIAYILSLYEDDRSLDPNLPRPTSVLILGHSMGGVVARSLFTMKNYKPGSVNTIVTAATPHMVPPVTLDFEISHIYNTIENYWIRGFLGPDAPLRNVSLVSIAGGNLDIVVNGDSGNIHNLVPQSNGFSVFTSSFPHAWVGADHVAILWCNQIATVIGKTLIDIVDANYSEQVKPLQERMKIFRNRFLTGIEDHVEKATYLSGRV